LLTLFAAAALVACSGGEKPAAAPPAAGGGAPAAGAPAADSGAAASGADSVQAGDFGVPECDDYMKKYMACIDKMPEAARAASKQALEQTKSAWQQSASTAEGKAALASGCTQASEAAKAGMQAYGCAW
jgi:hypothetical protein